MDLENESEESQDFSKELNDLNLINVKLKKKTILDSDSEVDESSAPEGINESIKQFASNGTQNPEELQNSAAGSTTALNEIENEISDKSTSGFHTEFEAEGDNDEGVPNIEVKRKKKSKRIPILDSDSEDELNTKEVDSKIDVEQSSNPLENHTFSKDNDKIHVSKENQNENYEGDVGISGDNDEDLKWKKKPKRIAIIDSDSEDGIPVTPHNKSFNDELNMPEMSNHTSSDLVAESNSEELRENIIKKSRFAALCDSESSEDENRYPTTSEESTQRNQKRAKTLKKSISKRSMEEPPGKKMTAKQALQQRQEIRSESQRMLRESQVSLPYHKPKAHSIKEFLQNRPRLSLSMLKTEHTPPSVAMKMSVQELEIVTKKLEEREKVVQEFYKSESESEEEDVQSEDTSTVQREENCEDNKEMVESNVATNEDKEKEIFENGELLTHSEDKESSPINSNSKEEEKIKEVVQKSENISEASLETSKMDISEIDSGAPEKMDHVKEHQEISVTANGSENQMNTDISATDVVDEPIMLNGNDEHTVPEGENNELENINTCEEETNIYKAQEEPATSLEEPEISSIKSNENNQEIEETNNQPSSVIDHFDDSVDFDFNLDGLDQGLSENFAEDAESNNCEILEKNSEQKERDTEEEHLQRLLKKYKDNLDNDCIKPATTTEKKLNKTDLLKQLGATKPCLSGGPDEVIDLDEDIGKPSGVAQLMERFMKHALTKNAAKNKVQLDVINLTQGEVVKETVAMSVDHEEEPISEKPGMKLKKLRDELQSQMAQRRSDLWHKKHQPLCESSNKETSDDEKSDCGADEDILDDDEEAEMTDSEDEEEDEYEEEVIKKLEKPRVKSAFIDEEAEESDEDECNNLSQKKEEEYDEDEELEEKEDAVQEDSNDYQSTTIRKPLRRILKRFTEDSDEEDNSQSMLESQMIEESDTGNKNTSFTSLNSTDSLEDDDNVPPNQPRTDKTPHKEMTQSNTVVLGLLTPVQHITGLQGFNSGSKFLRDSPVSPFLLPPDPSPFKDKNWNTDLQKKLFSNSCDALDSQASMEDIAQLCSGKFPSPTQVTARANSACSTTVENLATQDVISMCSGTFPDITPAAKDYQEENVDDALPVNEETNIETEVLTNTRPIMQLNLNSNEEIKSLDDDRLISELLDEEEMEQFKKKFESPIAPTLSNVNDYESEMEVKGGGRLMSDSSDDEGEEPKSKKTTKKLQKRLAFSDDSDSENEDDKDLEEINLHDDCSDDEFNNIDTNINKVIDYDSEENEIEFHSQEEVPRQKLKPSDFLENEAELSESDWDSADEDEKGLDALEFEQGDADVFDENKMRNDLEKIHMRRVLDQDNREIKILQELLLEDGELHGAGRQRQFRWKNIDDAENEDGQRDAEIEAYIDEEECEEQWRRTRHQREMFLKDKQEKHMVLENDDFISTDSNSQVLKLGQEALRKSLSAAPTVPEKPKATTSRPEVKKPLMLLNTRGSFLARTDKFLSKLAEFTKDTTTSTVGPQKNTKKIVFQTVSQITKETGIVNYKRKLENADRTPKLIKKLRLSSNLTPVVKNVERKKKLFK